ncbi:MAG: cbb3-type cytochrome c oxidase N-terminal domain-containing protein [Gemmatimonadota bacterium]
MSKETNRLLGHADEADGIDEYDNPLPDWWVGLFWFTIVWAIAYGVHYHFIANRSQEKALAAEMAAAEAKWPAQAAAEEMAAGVTFEVTPEAVAAGEAIFMQNCVACHGADLSGGIGPSFLDEEWLHGGQASDILRTITEGVPAKGMVPWRGILSPEQINQVAAFVIAKHSEATGRPIEDIVSGGEEGGG